ncbi:DUF4652 domain-containing protein [Alkalihalobacillus sp. 1P02AB]|uniref:DUF4652 domain-containing protein n=1 Tax=Alkalihalobacillus sp. 1P02AB TaxID=3132260 RepID=UPI0039A6056C
MYELHYDETEQVIFQVDPNGKKTIIANDSPSKPLFSKEKTKAIYITPLEWECTGNLYLYDLKTGHEVTLFKAEGDEQVPKYASWLDDDNVLAIIGYGMGTVCVGGNVYSINIHSMEKEQLTDYPNEIQITRFTVEDDTLNLEGIKYIDDELNQFVPYQEKIDLPKRVR